MSGNQAPTNSTTLEISVEDDRDAAVRNEVTSPSKQEYKVYMMRWVVLLVYCILNIFNAMIWTTFVSVSDIAQHYFSPNNEKSFYSSITGVNMLANIQLAVAVPGGFFAFWITKHQRPRRTMIFAGLITLISSIIKLIAAIYYDSLSIADIYGMMMLGQALAGFIQPSITNFPASLSSIWFPVQERDVSTSIASMCSAVGSALGSLVSPFLVTETANSDGTFTVHGFESLMVFQVITNAIALVLVFVFFWDAPPTSPSHSEQLKNQNEKVALDTVENAEALNEERKSPRTRREDVMMLGRDLYSLFTNKDYMVLMLCFALGVGLFNALITVLNQFVQPLGYSNTESGLFGAIFIVGGLIGAAIMAVLMQRTKDYRILAKGGVLVSNGMLLILLAVLYRKNFAPVMLMFFIFGLVTVPLIPLVVENCAEISYPVPEHISYGILMIFNIAISLGLSFAFQAVIAEKSWGSPPWRPINLLLYVVYLFLTIVVVFFYNGQYKRTVLDLENIPGILKHKHDQSHESPRENDQPKEVSLVPLSA